MTNQQASVLIALTRTHIPRTLDTIHAELGIPKPSIRRTISELRAAGYRIAKNEGTGTFALMGKPVRAIMEGSTTTLSALSGVSTV